ncbi:hypothetical protein [Methylocystis suflitae]|uniref:hypothetical protein n=1 Tax=Methylocystis suflitae TaxID=2951405 RepID=UPI00210EB4CC|nr:hypothetical protein [Methylocystis suflitae]MCQ4188588.1 hypothetical protein [Methylocystis suflitae]
MPNGIERTTDKLKRPLKNAIADLSALVNDYAVDVRLSADAIELTIEPTSVGASSAWAKSAAERLKHEFRSCPALRQRVHKWAQQQQEGEP